MKKYALQIGITYVILLGCFVYGQSENDFVCDDAADIENCLSCTNPETHCEVCEDHYYHSTYTGTCIECPEHCPTCGDPDSDGYIECITCDEYYHVEDGYCEECTGHCKSCEDSWTCAACDNGYRPEDRADISCRGCSEGCSSCADLEDTSCLTCAAGYYFVPVQGITGQCEECAARCESCISFDSCDRCIQGFTWTGASCDRCTDHCAVDLCDTREGCLGCEQGYWLDLDEAVCKPCENCAGGCDETAGCTSCDDGYVLNADHTCHECIDVDDPAMCTQCATRTRGRVYSQGQCLYCATHCLECSFVDPAQCLVCEDGYALDDENVCQTCDVSCLTCSGTTATSCTSCVSTHGLSADQECIDCSTLTTVPHCGACTTSTTDGGVTYTYTCNTCQYGFYMSPIATDPQYLCRSCGDVEGWESSQACLQCADTRNGRYMTDYMCVGCDQYGSECLTCNTDRCSRCMEGFFVHHTTGVCTACNDGNCAECADAHADSCIQCKTGYYLDDEGDCLQCLADCANCDDSISCNWCDDTYYVATDGICQSCEIENCANCDTDITQCDACSDGYGLASATSCVPCQVTGCPICASNAAVCSGCRDGKYLDITNNHCDRECLTNCDDCSSGTLTREGAYVVNADIVCDTCREGYVSTSYNLCHRCFENCDQCNGDGSMCTMCSEGYYWDGGACAACSEYCTTCTGPTNTECTGCRSDAYDNMAGGCEECDMNCETCGAPSTCLTCRDGLTLNSIDERCYNCDPTCLTCDGTTSTDCTTCADHFYVDISGACTACDSSCLTCSGGLSSDCLSCEDRKYLTGAAPASCGDCDITCLQCDGTSDSDCTMCPPGRYSDGAGACLDCHSTCSECSGPMNTDCTACYETGELLDATNMCTACATNCLTCSGMSADCDTCPEGAKLNSMDNMCHDCHETCAECDGTTSTDCTVCEPGYYLTATNTCEPCDDNCLTCMTMSTTCLTCHPNMSLNILDDVCYDCRMFENCAECDATECLRCDAPFIIVATDVCDACPLNCKECSNSMTCTMCNDGYGLTLTGCILCDVEKDCEHCDGAVMPEETCTSCYGGFRLHNGDCLPCDDDHCVTCDAAANVCTQCETGYQAANGVCIVCPPWCDSCVDIRSCGMCETTYRVTDVCDSCADSNCVECDDEDTCTLCEDRYYLNRDTNTCVQCGSDCASCSVTGCVECDYGFQLVITDCVARTASTLDNCAYDDEGDPSTCVDCVAGYYLDPVSHLCSDCSTATPGAADYVCDSCAGQGGANDNIQQWQAECGGCPDNCISCDSPDTCNACVDNMYTDGSSCITLPCDDLAGIAYEEACLLCLDYNLQKDDEHRGLFWNGEECLECPRNCERCSSERSCAQEEDECREGYVWDSQQELCIQCDLSTAAQCTGCVKDNTRGRYFNETQQTCHLCNQHCTKCENEGAVCTACDASYYLHNDTCFSCTGTIHSESGCNTCSATYTGWERTRVWSTVDGVAACRECPEHCALCNDINSCDVCEPRRYFFSNADVYECRYCILNCGECADAISCSACDEGYFYVSDVNNYCQECPHDCEICTHEEGCIQCDHGFYLSSDGVCNLCSGEEALDFCEACRQDGAYITCTQCSEGFYLTARGVCQRCKDNCAQCRDGDTCNTCSHGYCYDQVYAVCRDSGGRGCATCTLVDNVLTCTSCDEHRYLDICQRCDDQECATCNEDVAECQKCNDGFYLTDRKTCSACPINCEVCTEANKCSSCKSGTFWSDDRCTDCLEHCSTCSSTLTCTRCEETNMFVDDSAVPNVCQTCFNGCGFCSSTSTCTACYSGYSAVVEVADDGTSTIVGCLECPQGCDLCEISDSGTNCTQCTATYALTQGQCIPCSSFTSCVACNDSNSDGIIGATECTACNDGYHLSDSGDACLECVIEGCSTCLDRDYICTECTEEFRPSVTQYACATPCWLCMNHEECAEGPAGNETELAAVGSAYATVGCNDGCWVVSNRTSGGTVHFRGCIDDSTRYNCTDYTTEKCNSFIENVNGESEEGLECLLCCTGSTCNTAVLEGKTAGAGVHAASAALLTAALLLAATAINPLRA